MIKTKLKIFKTIYYARKAAIKDFQSIRGAFHKNHMFIDEESTGNRIYYMSVSQVSPARFKGLRLTSIEGIDLLKEAFKGDIRQQIEMNKEREKQ